MYTIKIISGNPYFADEIFSLEKECFGDFWSLQLISHELEQSKSLYIVCESDSKVTGYLNASVVLDEAQLNRIAVSKEYRQKGIGTKLISYLIDYLKTQSCTGVFLEVRNNNKNAIKLYKSFGFVTDGIRKKYYHNPDDDAVLMSLTL